MKKIKPPIRKYPGNKWLAERLDKHNAVTTVPYFHGVIRGALANPFPVDPAEAMAEAFNGITPSSLPPKELELLTLAFLHLWNDVARAYQHADQFPAVIPSDIRTSEDESNSLDAAVRLAEGFKTGFSIRKPPKGIKLDRTRTWLRDIATEMKWCRNQLEEKEKFQREYPKPEERALAIGTAFSWIEECMGWTALYARMDVDGNGRGALQADQKSLH